MGALRYTAGVDGMSALPLVRILAQPARVADGSTLYPGERVVGLVVSHPAWARPILLDGGSRAIVSGMLHYPRPGTNPTHLPCHKNLAVVAARAALGEQLARILGQGAAELLAPGLVGSTMASTVPTGAVPKVGKNSFRDIADGRDKRVSSTDWGTPLSPARGPAAEPPQWPPKHGPAANDGFRPTPRSMLGVVWVDDFVFHKRVQWHEACGGLAGGCLVCGRGLAAAIVLDEWWMDLNRQLGVSLNDDKHQRCKQAVEYAGFLFDTFRGLMLVLPDKQLLLLEQAASLGVTGALWSARELDSIKGRLLHYSAGVRHLRVLVTELQRLMGPVPEEEYDDIGPAPAGLEELSAEMCSVLARYAPLGRPLWPPPASSAYATFLRGEAPALFCALTWDASTFGWAALARWWDLAGPSPVSREQLLVGTWPPDWDVSEQPYREGLGGALSFEAFVVAADIRGRFCVLRNDAAAAIAAFRKGSTQSPQMQRCALRLDRAAARANVDCLPCHVPGLVLVAEGVDGASRAGSELGPDANVAAVLGPAVDDQVWSMARQVAAAAGWRRITVDAFASASNARAPRFWSRFLEPGAEAADALCLLDWAQSVCPVCGSSHREVLYAFPPLRLVAATVEKACADRALCVLIVPVSILAPHWSKLLYASALPIAAPYLDGFLRIRSPAKHLTHSGDYAPSELAVFACDFSRLDPRPGLPPLSSCPGAFAPRLRPQCGGEMDLRDRLRLREALLARRGLFGSGAAD